MKITTTEKHKSIPAGLTFDLPEFCILTGRNGSGKSHLLEIMSDTNKSFIEANGKTLQNILHIGYGELTPKVDERCETSQLISSANNMWLQIQHLIDFYNANSLHMPNHKDIIKDYVIPHGGINTERDAVIRNVLRRSGKKFGEIEESDIYRNMSFSETPNNSLFFTQCAAVFKAYQVRWTKNQFNEFLIGKGSVQNLIVLNEEDFLRTYGPAPWDLINEILSKANLPYEFSNPTHGDIDLAYVLRLKDRLTGTEISINDLSSGEKVLMSIALAIYNTQEGGNRPDILLIDEPDAPLHPQFSKLLIETVAEVIVKRAGVKVVMTTHSPTTVAMAPDNSVFEIIRETKAPVLVSNSRAVSILTQGIGSLHVSYEKRRQIFVESKYDVMYYEKLFDVLQRKYNYSYHPIFMEPHSGTPNCTDVISIVDKLHAAGNDLAWGIIDYDGSNEPREKILVLGGRSRYAIENYVLDPLYIVLALVRYGKFSYSDYGLPDKRTYLDALHLSESECQTLINSFIEKIGLPIEDLENVKLENGYNLTYPKSFLMHNGHDYEILIQSKVPELSAISRGKGDSALKLGVVEVIGELPQFLPVEINLLFAAID